MFILSLSLCPACLVHLNCEILGKWPHACNFVGCCFKDFSKQHGASLCSFDQALSLSISFECRSDNHTTVSTGLQLGRNPVLF